MAEVRRHESRAASAGNITEQGAYHLVYRRAMPFFGDRGANPRPHARQMMTGCQARCAEIPHPSSSDGLRMTGFGFGARGHAKYLLKTSRSKITHGRTKSKYYCRRSGGSLFVVTVEAAAGFSAQPAGGYVLLQQRAGAVFGVAQALVEDVHDIDADIE